jgi:hypothetical protein
VPVRLFNIRRSYNGFRPILILVVYIKAVEKFRFGPFLFNKVGTLHETETEFYRFLSKFVHRKKRNTKQNLSLRIISFT